MISSPEWLRIKAMIVQAMDVILSGNTAGTQVDNVVGTESIDNLLPGMTTIEGRPVAHPYGLVSRAPVGTAQVTARQGDHPGNRLVLLHRDKNRPSLANEGEVMIYDAFGNQIYLKNGEIQVGNGASKAAARAGDAVDVFPDATPGTPVVLTVLPLVNGATTITITAPAAAAPSTNAAKVAAGSGTVKIVD